MSNNENAKIKNSIVAKLLEEKELDRVFGGGAGSGPVADSFEQRIDCPPCGEGGGAFWNSTKQN